MAHIWIDGDACPRECLAVVEKAILRTGASATVVSNKWLRLSAVFTFLHVPGGLDQADDEIVKQAQPGELCLTADIPLAARLITQGLQVIDFRGGVYTESNIAERLSVRNFLSELREGGVRTGGPAPFDNRAKQQFAGALDSWLHKAFKN